VIATRHNSHAKIAEEALRAGKHVYLEKPMALNNDELAELDKLVRSFSTSPVLMVGYNRRYAPLIETVKKNMSARSEPVMGLYRVNAGALPAGHWIHSEEGGGRLRGEACHMLDVFQYLIGAPLKGYAISSVSPNDRVRPDENFSAQCQYEDGSLCTLVYTSLGHESVPKEYVELHWGGNTAILDDFRSLDIIGGQKLSQSSKQDKGHLNALQTFYQSMKSGISFPTPWDQLVETSRACIDLDLEAWGKTDEPCVES